MNTQEKIEKLGYKVSVCYYNSGGKTYFAQNAYRTVQSKRLTQLLRDIKMHVWYR